MGSSARRKKLRAKKRKFTENQHTSLQTLVQNEEGAPVVEDSQTQEGTVQPQKSPTETEETLNDKLSASARKIKVPGDLNSETNI